MRQYHLALVALLTFAAAAPVAAQFTQYVEPGNQPLEELPTLEDLDRAMAEARWNIGGLRVDPWIGLRNVGWVGDVGGGRSDFTASAGAGLQVLTGLGPKAVLTAHALPEYTWWSRSGNRSVWNGRYGAGAFGFYNRLRFRLLASTEQSPRYVNSEFGEPVNAKADHLEAGLEVNLSGHLAVFASGERNLYSYRQRDIPGPTGLQLILLNRTDDRARGGLRYYLSSDVSIGVGAQTMETDFDHPQRDRSSSGDAGLLELRFERARLTGHAVALFTQLDPETGSEFVPYDGTLGTFDLRWRPGAKLEWEVYGYRNLVYSLEEPSPYYTDERVGLALAIPMGWRSDLRFFVESGRDDYVTTEAGLSSPDRDATSYGARLGLKLGAKARFELRLSHSDYTYPGDRSRSVDRIQTSLSLGGGAGGWY